MTTNVIFTLWSSRSRLRELAGCNRYFVLHGLELDFSHSWIIQADGVLEEGAEEDIWN
jgi:hypothetical protein